jgi:hypothetical protein
MAIGPVQLLVLGFQQPRFRGEILEELDRLRDDDVVRVVDALVVYKDAAGNVEGMQGSQLGAEELADDEAGATVGALVGLGPENDLREADAELAVEAVEPGGEVFGQEAWNALAEIPTDTAAALILLEHRWAIPLRDAIARAGGFRLASAFVSPLDLASLGLVPAEEAEALAPAERDAVRLQT